MTTAAWPSAPDITTDGMWGSEEGREAGLRCLKRLREALWKPVRAQIGRSTSSYALWSTFAYPCAH